MLVSLVVILADRAGILRSAHLPRHMAVEAAAMGKGVLPRVLAVVEATSVQRATLRPHRVHGAQEAEAEAVRLLVSVP